MNLLSPTLWHLWVTESPKKRKIIQLPRGEGRCGTVHEHVENHPAENSIHDLSSVLLSGVDAQYCRVCSTMFHSLNGALLMYPCASVPLVPTTYSTVQTFREQYVATLFSRLRNTCTLVAPGRLHWSCRRDWKRSDKCSPWSWRGALDAGKSSRELTSCSDDRFVVPHYFGSA